MRADRSGNAHIFLNLSVNEIFENLLARNELLNLNVIEKLVLFRSFVVDESSAHTSTDSLILLCAFVFRVLDISRSSDESRLRASRQTCLGARLYH